MSETVITVTEAARNFADWVNRAHYQKQTFLLLNNGVPFARLVPAGPTVCSGRDLAKALDLAELSDADAGAWNREVKEARNALKAPSDKWQ
jgi:antitoxin (DNA-binding transcriptional repressor) of toxin-antitoxin stability system